MSDVIHDKYINSQKKQYRQKVA